MIREYPLFYLQTLRFLCLLNWLLGFIEGEAWFHVKIHTSTLIFGLGQTINLKPIIEVKLLINIFTI
jgi:hypothetical protein